MGVAVEGFGLVVFVVVRVAVGEGAWGLWVWGRRRQAEWGLLGSVC